MTFTISSFADVSDDEPSGTSLHSDSAAICATIRRRIRQRIRTCIKGPVNIR